MADIYFGIEKYGKLYIDKVLFESTYPILFTCRDEGENLFYAVVF